MLRPEPADRQQTHTVDFRVDEVFGTLGTMIFLGFEPTYPALSEWMRSVIQSLSEEQLLFLRTFFSLGPIDAAAAQQMAALTTFPGYIDWLRSLDPKVARNNHLDQLVELTGESTSIDALREDEERYATLMFEAIEDRGTPDAGRVAAESWSFVAEPAAYLQRAADHLHRLWDDTFEAAWRAALPHLQQAVEALTAEHMGVRPVRELVRSVTGRDIDRLDEEKGYDAYTHISFVPTLPVGPYLGFFDVEDHLLITFEPRDVPLGHAQLSRSELLVRLNALADDTRLRILDLLTDHEELSSPQIMELLALSQSAASRHLRQLSLTGYLNERRHEGAKVYSLNVTRINDTLRAMETFFAGG